VNAKSRASIVRAEVADDDDCGRAAANDGDWARVWAGDGDCARTLAAGDSAAASATIAAHAEPRTSADDAPSWLGGFAADRRCRLRNVLATNGTRERLLARSR
jgi:hypothetical protein